MAGSHGWLKLVRHADAETLLPRQCGDHVLVFAERVRVHQRKGDAPEALEPELVELRADINHVRLLKYPDDLAGRAPNKVGVGVDVDGLRVRVHEKGFDGDSLVDLDNGLVKV